MSYILQLKNFVFMRLHHIFLFILVFCFSIADTALAFAANSHNLKSLSIETSISLIKKINSGDIIIAETNEISRNNKTAVYAINITNKSDQILASFKGTVFVTTKKWIDE